jgi:hypothetical protein
VNAGVEQLVSQLAALSDALESYRDPVVDEHAGLRLMHDTLSERAEHIRSTIVTAQTSSLSLTLSGPAVTDGAIPVPVLTELLAAVQAAVHGTAEVDTDEQREATTLHLAGIEATDDGVRIALVRPRGPLEAQLVDADTGELLFDRAVTALLAALAADEEGATAVSDIAAVVARHPASLALSSELVSTDDATATVTRADAQRLTDPPA